MQAGTASEQGAAFSLSWYLARSRMGLNVYQQAPSYSFEFSFLWVFAALAGLAVVAIAASIPYYLFRIALQNRFRLDGTVSRRRTWREVRHLLDFLGGLLLVPFFVVVLMGGSLVLVHHYVIPVPLVADLALMFSPDPAVMEARTETGRLGDVGLIYGEWSERQGFSAERAYTWRKFLKRNALLLALGAALFSAFCYWFVTRYYFAAVVAYQQDVFRRRQRYHRRDRAEAARRKKRPRRREIVLPSQKLLP